MQRIFAEEGPWQAPWMSRTLPAVAELAARYASQTIFTRFIPPRSPEEMPNRWQHYYRHWREMTREHLDPRLLELVSPLGSLVPPALVVDKPVYSPFAGRRLATMLRERRADTLVVTGAETDVCVLATVLGAVDHGYHVVLVADALCSSSDSAHDALMTLFDTRFSLQVDTATADGILDAWRPAGR